jgi:hypothetical protein
MDTPGGPEPTDPRFIVNHDVDRHQWQVIDRPIAVAAAGSDDSTERVWECAAFEGWVHASLGDSTSMVWSEDRAARCTYLRHTTSQESAHG